jgi:uncharacterized membrane protein
MKRSLLALLVVCIFIIPGPTGAVLDCTRAPGPEIDVTSDHGFRLNVAQEAGQDSEIRIPLNFGELRRADYDEYTQLLLDGADGLLLTPGAPVLPVAGHMLSLPVNSIVTEVQLENGEYFLFTTDKKIVPAPEPTPLIFGAEPEPLYEGETYGSSSLYPTRELEFMVTTGRGDNGDIVAHVFARVFPVRYNPVTGQLVLLEAGELVVKYTPPEVNPFSRRDSNETYDVLVLCPLEFYNESLRYKNHREAMGWRVKVVSLDNVYDDSIINTSSGRDDQERIKYFIKGAIEKWGIEHLLVMGDIDKFPIRKVRIEDIDGTNTPTDHYFSDIYKQGTLNLSDWNSDGDAYWGESRNGAANADNCDMDPDVHVGRLPASTEQELRNMINKTIMYDENITADDAHDWYRNVTFVGSDTFGGSSGGVAEGEFALNTAAAYIPGFNISKFYEKSGTFVRANIFNSINRGASLMSFSDHGSTGGVVWTSGGYGPGLSRTDAASLTNGHKLPLSIQDACLTNNIDTSDSLGENIVLNPNGGGIGSMGATRIGWGMWDTWHITRLSGYMGVHIVEGFSLGHILPGELLDFVRVQYVTNIGFPNLHDFKTLVSYIHYGDPVVMLGGPSVEFYPTNEEEIIWAEPGEQVSLDVEIHSRALHDNTVNFTIVGGNWSYALNTTGFNLTSNATGNVTINYTVDEKALAYESDTFVLEAKSAFVTLPVKKKFTTYVKAVHDVNFEVNATEMSGLPGENRTLEFSIVNNGNILENVTVTLKGGNEQWSENISLDPVEIQPFDMHEDNISLQIPEDALATVYYFELFITTDSGINRTFVIRITVDEVHGLLAYAIEDTGIFVDEEETVFNIFVENLGNHKDIYLIEILEPEPVGWTIEHSPVDVELFSAQNTTALTISVSGLPHKLEGEYAMSVNISSSSDANTFQVVPLTIVVERFSSIDLVAAEEMIPGDQGKKAEFELNVLSYSNFDEVVNLSVLEVPGDWVWTLEEETLNIPAFQGYDIDLSLQIPEKTLAGEYSIQLKAEGENSTDVLDLVVSVRRETAIELNSDKVKVEVLPGGTAEFEVTISNMGNAQDLILIKTKSGNEKQVFAYSSTSAVTLEAWSNETLEVHGRTSSGTKPKEYTIEIEAVSYHDQMVTDTLALVVKVKFVPRTELDFRYDSMTTLWQGESGLFDIDVENLGNVNEQLVAEYNGTLPWNIKTEPGEFSLEPDKSGKVTVFFTVPSDCEARDYQVTIDFTSPNGEWKINHTVRVLAKAKVQDPDKPLHEQQVNALPFLIIIIVLIAALVVAIIFAARRRGGGQEPVTAAAPPPPAPAQEQWHAQQPLPPDGPVEGGGGPAEEEEDVVTLLDIMMEDPDEIE